MTNSCPIHAVLLAAGSSTRFGAADKLLANAGGQALVVRTAALLVASGLDGVTAVVQQSPDGDAVAAALSGLSITITRNASAARGMGTSIACGCAAVPDPRAAVMIVPADMPLLDRDLLQTLMTLFRAHDAQKIVHPVTPEGEQRNPVIWPLALREDLQRLDGHSGGKHLLSAHASRVVTHMNSSHVFEDIDTQDDLMRFQKSVG